MSLFMKSAHKYGQGRPGQGHPDKLRFIKICQLSTCLVIAYKANHVKDIRNERILIPLSFITEEHGFPKPT